MTARTLLLTPHYTPHKVLPWESAICLLYLGKVEVIEEYEEVICSPSVAMKMPAVVRLKRAIGSTKRAVTFSRQNVFARDKFRCCYCGAPGTYETLNYDHVVPRAQGGRTIWENIVTTCYGCNGRKADRTPEQAGMQLLARPYKPKTLPMTSPQLRIADVHPVWLGYLGNSVSAVA
jgi:5-methylcytosine-specific restriction endonuclease McrA